MRTASPVTRNLLIGGLFVGAVICCTLILTSRRSEFELSLARVVDVRDREVLSTLDFRFRFPTVNTNDDWVVVMRARNPDRRTVWFGQEKVQLKVQGRWLEPEAVAWLNSKYFCAMVPGHSQADFVVAVVPHRTEAVRLIIEYLPEPALNRAHSLTLYYASRDYLYGGRYTRFQKLRARLLLGVDSWAIDPLRRRAISRQWPIKTVEFELPSRLPARPQFSDTEHNENTSADGGLRVQFAFVAQWPAAAEFLR